MSAVSHTNLPPFSACCLHPSKPEHRWSRLRFNPLRLTTASAFGSRDCRLRLHYRFLPTPLLRHGVGPLSLRLRQQTLFKGYSNALSRHRSYVAVSGASLYPLPRNLRLLFRLVRTGIFTPSSGRLTAAGRHHPPTHKRTDERTVFSPWHSLHLSPRAGMLSASIIFPSRNVSVAMAFNRSFRQSLASPTSPTPSIAVHGSCLPVNSDRFGSRVERLSPPSPFSLPPDTAPASRCRVAAITPTSINSL